MRGARRRLLRTGRTGRTRGMAGSTRVHIFDPAPVPVDTRTRNPRVLFNPWCTLDSPSRPTISYDNDHPKRPPPYDDHPLLTTNHQRQQPSKTIPIVLPCYSTNNQRQRPTTTTNDNDQRQRPTTYDHQQRPTTTITQNDPYRTTTTTQNDPHPTTVNDQRLTTTTTQNDPLSYYRSALQTTSRERQRPPERPVAYQYDPY